MQAAFQCDDGPEGDATDLWREQPGYGWFDRAVLESPSAVNLYVVPDEGFSIGPVDMVAGERELGAVQIVVSECFLPDCPWTIVSGSVHAFGELGECVDPKLAVTVVSLGS